MDVVKFFQILSCIEGNFRLAFSVLMTVVL